MEDKNTRIAILWGPPGCGKNAMIEAFCTEKDLEILRFSDWKVIDTGDG